VPPTLCVKICSARACIKEGRHGHSKISEGNVCDRKEGKTEKKTDISGEDVGKIVVREGEGEEEEV
jgi:hypothetical protein